MTNATRNVLELSASGRHEGSATRELSADLIAALDDRYGDIATVRRDVSKDMPFVDADWIEANFTPDELRTKAHAETLAFSDELVEELQNADTLVIGVPVYNFSIPASLKAWIDMIARARSTFPPGSGETHNSGSTLVMAISADRTLAPGSVPSTAMRWVSLS